MEGPLDPGAHGAHLLGFARPGRPADPEHVEQRVLEHVERFARTEQVALDAYRALAYRALDPRVRYVAELLWDEEDRHHTVLADLAGMLRRPDDRPDPAPGPAADEPEWSPELAREMRDATERLVALERVDLACLRQLRRELRSIRADPAMVLLVELLAHDTRKHIHVLGYLRAALRHG